MRLPCRFPSSLNSYCSLPGGRRTVLVDLLDLGQVVGEPAVAGPEGLGLGGLGVPVVILKFHVWGCPCQSGCHVLVRHPEHLRVEPFPEVCIPVVGLVELRLAPHHRRDQPPYRGVVFDLGVLPV